MVKLKKHALNGKEVGELDIDDAFLEFQANNQMIKDYIVALRANARQWSANTRGRAEVKHTTKKPYKQKGTGQARHGNLVTAQFRGGGIVFGPKPKFDQHVKINRKERQAAIHTILAQKVKGNQIIVMEDAAFNGALKKPETKVVANFLKKQNLFGRKLLFVGEGVFEQIEEKKVSVASDKHRHFKLSMRNIPRSTFTLAANVNGYDLLAAWAIVMTESAFNELKELVSERR